MRHTRDTKHDIQVISLVQQNVYLHEEWKWCNHGVPLYFAYLEPASQLSIVASIINSGRNKFWAQQ